MFLLILQLEIITMQQLLHQCYLPILIRILSQESSHISVNPTLHISLELFHLILQPLILLLQPFILAFHLHLITEHHIDFIFKLLHLVI